MKTLRKTLYLFFALLAFAPGAWAQSPDFITDVAVLGQSNSIQLQMTELSYTVQGYTVINHNLNAGCTSGDYIHLLYRKQSSQNSSGTPITGFYILAGNSSNAPDQLTHEGRTYTIVPYDGSTNFINSKGDLNRGAGGAYIHLYYTKDPMPTHQSVTGITFNSTQSGGVGANGDNTTGYDLNSGAGGDYIYMHVATGQITVTLNSSSEAIMLYDGFILTGTGGSDTRVSIANGATVTLSGASITSIPNDFYHQWAGLRCLGDAVIVLDEGTTNAIMGGYAHPGIHVPQNHTLTLQGNGTLNATGNIFSAGIGGGYNNSSCGDITINGGNITATGGQEATGIGSGGDNSGCGNITINGGNVTATGGQEAAGIGGGHNNSSCGNITITSGNVIATGGYNAAGIGGGRNQSSCGNITISGGTVTANGSSHGAGIGGGSDNSSCSNITLNGGTVTANGGPNCSGIGSGFNQSPCGDITISGGTVNATGGAYTPSIGAGFNQSSCGDITITNGVTRVTAIKGTYGNNSIGASNSSTCGTITIGGVVTGNITQSPFVTFPYTIAFNANGGEGTMSDQSFMYNVAQNLNANTFTNGLHPIFGWATSANGPKVYDDGQSVSNLADTIATVNLYAKWRMHFIMLASSTGEVLLQNGDTLTGTGGGNTHVSIADGATVTLSGANITNINYDEYHIWPGLTCLGDAVIVLDEGTTNAIKGGAQRPGIHVPQGHTLTIQGSGTLNATGNTYAAGIGGNYQSSCGNITINGGTVTATGGACAAGIGSGFNSSSCGHITINGGNVTANGGTGAAGIGSGDYFSSCGNITLSGGTITAHGGDYSPGIGCGDFCSDCGNITITNGVTRVTAIKGTDCDNAIGESSAGYIGTITIGGVVTGNITQSPFVTFPYTVSFNANGGSGTMSDQGFMYNVAQNLHTNGFNNGSLSFEGWATSAEGPKVYDDGQSASNLADTIATVPLYAKWIIDPTHLSVNGDEYTIHTVTGWELFCDLLADNSNGYFTGKTVKLDADISVTRMAGSSGHAFSGTFDGQGHTLTVSYTTTEQYTAPFRYVNGATITNLVTAGTISTSKKFASGMIGGTLGGAVSITNCKVDVTINSSINGDGTHGGFVALASYGTLNITGCTFSGQMLGENTINCGGFVGWTESNNNATTTITDCLFAPTTLEISSGRTFSRARNMSSVTLTNSYYTEPLGTPQGIHGINHPGVQPTGNPTATYNVSGISVYSNGMQHGTTFYYNPNNNFVLDIEGYDYVSNPGGWYLIASPVVEAIAPSADNGFIANEYDLYYFNQSTVGEEWRNYKDDNFLLNNGTGYLYASEIATTLVFTGTPYTGSGEIELAYNPNVPDFDGWNLVGNPYAQTASVDRDFYVMNGNRSEVIAAEGNTVEAMEGIFVVADGNDETVTFSPMTRGTNQQEERIVLNLSRNNGTVIDRAIVRFGEGKPFPKFQMNPSHTKVYIPQDGKDYAIVSVSACRDGVHTVSTMPVNFKAEHNGTYTLTFSSENIDFDYLHLIDNMTGADVDLLVPNGGDAINRVSTYTFEAKTTDYESRFKLVFSICGDANGDNGAFAYIHNGDIIINGEGLLQVIDVMGHVILSGDAMNRVSTGGMTAGVYVLRLINGNDVKTQKIVIE